MKETRCVAAARVALMLLLALLLSVPTALAGAVASAAPQAPPSGGKHGLDWGYKASFRSYIGEKGIFVADGAVRNADGTFHFPLQKAEYDPVTRSTRASFTGTIEFRAYCSGGEAKPETCLLRTLVKKPTITISATEQILTAEFSSAPRSAPGKFKDYGRLALARLGLGGAQVATAEGSTTWRDIRTVLTAESGGDPTSYEAGTAMDALSFSYPGQGDQPELGERLSEPGRPAFAEGLRLPIQTPQSYTSQPWIFPSTRSPIYFTADFFNEPGQPTAVEIAAYSETDKKEIGRATIPTDDLVPTAFDPQTDSLFTVRHENGRSEAVRVQWTGSGFQVTPMFPVADISDFANQVTVLAWNGSALFLLQMRKDERPKVIEWTPAATTEHELPYVDEVPELSAVSRRDTNSFYGPRQPPAVQGQTLFIPLHNDLRGRAFPPPLVTVTLTNGKPIINQHSQFGRSWVLPLGDGRMVLPSTDAPYLIRTARFDGQGRLVGDIGSVPSGPNPAPEVAIGGGTTDGRGTAFMATQSRNSVLVHRDGKVLGMVEARGTQISRRTNPIPLAYARDGLYALAIKGEGHEVIRLDKLGETATFTTQPASGTVTLTEGQRSAEVTLTAAATGEPAPTLQWQQQLAGESVFTDIPQATGGDLTVKASVNTDGARYRVLAKNAAGVVSSQVATITVHSAPLIESQPVKAAVYQGQEATFSVLATGTGKLNVGWEFKEKGKSLWNPLALDENFVGEGTRLLIKRPGLDLDGYEFRAVLSNEYGTVRSQAAPLSVQPRPTTDTTRIFEGVTFDWAGSAEWQAQPPNGSAAHYFSAGVSGGDQRSYRADADGVRILQRDKNGKDRPAAWDRRGEHVTAGGNQVIRLTKGRAVIKPDGAATIEWPNAAFSVNFYDGLVPTTMANLKATIEPGGRGELRADLSGYAGDMSNPNKPKEPVAPRRNVVMANFRNVVVDPERGFIITPDYAGVQVNTPAGQTAQKRTDPGWGSWPQQFIDFHFTTGLAAYHYSTGGTFDAKKAPAAIGIGFGEAKQPVPPAPKPDPGVPGGPGGGGRPEVVPAPPTLPLPGVTPGGSPLGPPSAGGTGSRIEGTLLWGVKSSFRSYISGPIAKGRITLQGAGSDGGSFRFGQAGTDWEPNRGTGTTRYRGGVNFWGHGGILNLTMSDPAIRIDSPGRGTLLMSVAGPGQSGGPVELGELDLGAAAKQASAAGVAYNNVPVRLTAAGSRVFSYQSSVFYQPGTAMDPLSFVVGANARPGSAGGGQPTRSGTPVLSGPRTGGTGPRTGVTDPTLARAAQQAMAPMAPGAQVGCKVESATINWGFKESFRAYISGTIANGQWETTDGATYRTPRFGWQGGTGSYDGKTRQGQVDFAGGIRFTGHKGLLDTKVEKPRIRFVDEKSAVLILDVAGVTMEDALAGKKEPKVIADAPFVVLDLSRGQVTVSPDGKTLIAENVPAALTEQGYSAFPNYPVGTAFDPISFSVTTGDQCAGVPVAPVDAALTADAPPPVVQPVVDAAAVANPLGQWGWAWLALIGGGIALLAAGISTTVAILLHRSSMNRMLTALTGGAVADAGDGAPEGVSR